MATKSYVSLTVARGVSAAAQMVLLVVVARAVGGATFGYVAATFGVVAVVSTLADGGVATAAMRDVAKERLAAGAAIARLSRTICLVVAALLVAGLVLLGAWRDPLFLSLAPLAVWGAAEKNGETWGLVLVARDREGLFSSVVAGRRLAALLLFLAVPLDDPVLRFSTSLAVTSAVAWGVLQVAAGRLLPAGPRAPLRAVWHNRAFGINALAGQVRDLDTFLVAAVSSPLGAGAYGLGTRLWQPVLIAANAAVNIVLRDASRAEPDVTRRVLARGWMYAVALAVVLPVVALALGPVLRWAVPWLDLAGVLTVGFLGAAVVLVGYGSVVATALVALGDEVVVSRLNLGFAAGHVLVVLVVAATAPEWAIGLVLTVPYLLKIAAFQHRLATLPVREPV